MRKYDLTRLRMLIIDDNRQFLAIMRTMLRGFGVQDIFESTDAVQALEILRQTEIDLALLDLNLGDIDGLEWARLVRSAPDSQNPRMPIIMVTAFSERSNVEAAIDAGIDEFLVKPLSPNILFRRIVSVIEDPRPYMRDGSYFGPDRQRSVTRRDLEHCARPGPDGGGEANEIGNEGVDGVNTPVDQIDAEAANAPGNGQSIDDLASSVRDVSKVISNIVGAIERQNDAIEGINQVIQRTPTARSEA